MIGSILQPLTSVNHISAAQRTAECKDRTGLIIHVWRRPEDGTGTVGTDKDAPIDCADSNELLKRLSEGELKLAWLDDVAKGAPGGPGNGVVVRGSIHRGRRSAPLAQ